MIIRIRTRSNKAEKNEILFYVKSTFLINSYSWQTKISLDSSIFSLSSSLELFPVKTNRKQVALSLSKSCLGQERRIFSACHHILYLLPLPSLGHTDLVVGLLMQHKASEWRTCLHACTEQQQQQRQHTLS